MAKPLALLATTTRSGLVECEHYGHLVVADVNGNLVAASGDAEFATFMRSSAKPLQAMTCIQHGAGERFQWTDEELAVVCASHSAEDIHRSIVRRILAQAELTEDHLQCGPHPPLSDQEREYLIRAGQAPGRVHSNCSGKHAGMLSCCRAAGWPTETYRDPGHPLQQANIDTLARMSGIGRQSIRTGTDGCGVPSFFVALSGMATAFARLANPDGLANDDRASAMKVAAAIAAHPRLIAGTGRFDTLLLDFAGQHVVCKGGAEGVFCAGIRGQGLGLALKTIDGNARAHPAIVGSWLARWLGALDWAAFLEKSNRPLTNTRGERIGAIHAA